MSGSSPLAEVVDIIAVRIESVLGPGDVATLRRVVPGGEVPSFFWHLVFDVLEPRHLLFEGDERVRDTAERRWLALVAGMATARGLHRRGVRLGRALVDAGVSEMRFLRLLRRQGDALLDEVATLARLLTAKRQVVDWLDVVKLVLSDGRDDAETVRRNIARDYYRSAHHTRRGVDAPASGE